MIWIYILSSMQLNTINCVILFWLEFLDLNSKIDYCEKVTMHDLKSY
jgi:hypothetical protein